MSHFKNQPSANSTRAIRTVSATISGDELSFTLTVDGSEDDAATKTYNLSDLKKGSFDCEMAYITTPNDQQFNVENLLAATFAAKESTANFCTRKNQSGVLAVLFPYADSTLQDAILIANADTFNVDGTAITETKNMATGLGGVVADLMPTITLTHTDGAISVATNPVKDGLKLELTTTTGYLSETQLTTGSDGTASTTLNGATSGKVKANLTNFTGIAEVVIS